MSFGISEKAVVNSILSEIDKLTLQKEKLVLPFELLIFPSIHDGDTKHDIERADYEARCIIAFRRKRVKEHTRKSVLKRMKTKKVKDASFRVIEGKSILVRLTG